MHVFPYGIGETFLLSGLDSDALLFCRSLMSDLGTVGVEGLDQSNRLEELVGVSFLQNIPDYRVILLYRRFFLFDYRIVRVPILGAHWCISPYLSPLTVNWLKEFSVT